MNPFSPAQCISRRPVPLVDANLHKVSIWDVSHHVVPFIKECFKLDFSVTISYLSHCHTVTLSYLSKKLGQWDMSYMAQVLKRFFLASASLFPISIVFTSSRCCILSHRWLPFCFQCQKSPKEVQRQLSPFELW